MCRRIDVSMCSYIDVYRDIGESMCDVSMGGYMVEQKRSEIDAKMMKNRFRGLLGQVLEELGANLVHKGKINWKSTVLWAPLAPKLGANFGSCWFKNRCQNHLKIKMDFGWDFDASWADFGGQFGAMLAPKSTSKRQVATCQKI